MTKVVLLGDSIRTVGYGPLVPGLLGKDYEVWQPEENCRFAKYTLRMIFDYQNQINGADIIHWNNGLWDCTNLFDDGLFTSYEEYETNILRIARILKTFTPHVIFATTTPVRKENIYDNNEEIVSFNERIVPKLKEMGIKINDFYTPFSHDIPRYIRKEDLIHPTEEGAKLLADMVVEKVKEEEKLLDKKENKGSHSIRPLDTGRPVLVDDKK